MMISLPVILIACVIIIVASSYKALPPMVGAGAMFLFAYILFYFVWWGLLYSGVVASPGVSFRAFLLLPPAIVAFIFACWFYTNKSAGETKSPEGTHTMVCPRCGSEYRSGFYRCSQCDVDLIDK